MRTTVLSAVLLTSLTAIPAAALEDSGAPAFDRSTRTLFVDGQPYHLPQSLGTIRLAGADYVFVTWEQQGDRRVVQRYSAEYEDD